MVPLRLVGTGGGEGAAGLLDVVGPAQIAVTEAPLVRARTFASSCPQIPA